MLYLLFKITPSTGLGRKGRVFFLVKMRVLLRTVIFCLAVGLTISTTDTYKAAVISDAPGHHAYAPLIQEAARSNVDILVLPPVNTLDTAAKVTTYDDAVRAISSAAKEHSLYVVAQLLENIRCLEKTELVRNNLVFNRQGSIISIYKKPVDPSASCNGTATEIGSFITDFGVTFGVLMEEDLVIQNLTGVKGVRNFVLAGTWQIDIPALAAPQFFTSWAFTTGSNLLSTSGIFAGKAGARGRGANIIVSELKKDGEAPTNLPATAIKTPHSEDLSQYSIKPLDLAASDHGVQETVCHGAFCCQFYVKTSSIGSQEPVSYGLAAFDGIRHIRSHNVGVQSCAVLPCAGSYKRSCDLGSVNNTNIIFEEISITGSFKLKNSAQFPVILSTDTLSSRFQFTKDIVNHSTEVTVKLYDGQKLLNFGIYGRDFSKDYESKEVVYTDDGITYNTYDYIKEDVIDFFDYLWITFRIPIFVVSIYVLEMM